MKLNSNKISNRKQDHLDICLNNDVNFSSKTTGFENYEFEHYAITEIDFNSISISTDFFGKHISYPFLISCMTGGTTDAGSINEKLAVAAQELNIPVGVGSQRSLLESDDYLNSYKSITKNAGNVPILGNIGASQAARFSEPADTIKKLVDIIEASAMVIHVNPLQELIQFQGEPNFKGLLKNIEIICRNVDIPIIVKEVGSGISKNAAEVLLNTGVKGIDVAGAGGTSWAAVEMKRNKNEIDSFLRNWGLPTAYCIKEIKKLKLNYEFLLIGSGGISDSVSAAKALALGADITASAKTILKTIVNENVEGVIKLVKKWFSDITKIMYLTNCSKLSEFQGVTLINKKELI